MKYAQNWERIKQYFRIAFSTDVFEIKRFLQDLVKYYMTWNEEFSETSHDFSLFVHTRFFTLKLSKEEKKKKNFVQMENITFRRYNKTTKTWTACKLLFQYLMIELSSFDFNLSWKKFHQLGSFVFKISIFFVDTTILLAKEKRNLHFWTNISNKLRSKWLHSIQLADNANFTPLNFLIYLENFLNIKSIKKWR